MKKTSTPKPRRVASDYMRPEYHFDYTKARPNRFAGRIDQSQLVVVLEPDIAAVFTTPESVNQVLRALIATMPSKTKPKTARGLAGGR